MLKQLSLSLLSSIPVMFLPPFLISMMKSIFLPSVRVSFHSLFSLLSLLLFLLFLMLLQHLMHLTSLLVVVSQSSVHFPARFYKTL